MHIHVHSEVIEAFQMAWKDACLWIIAVLVIGQHIHKLQDASVVRCAVCDVQVCSKGNDFLCGCHKRLVYNVHV